MIISDVGKLGLIGVFLVGLFVLVGANTIDFGDAAPFFTLIAGYLFGNGAAAVRRSAGTSVIVPRLNGGEVLTVDGSYPASVQGSDGHG